MPIVRVEMFPGRTHAQKQELARAITEAVANIAHTTPDATIVIFSEIEPRLGAGRQAGLGRRLIAQGCMLEVGSWMFERPPASTIHPPASASLGRGRARDTDPLPQRADLQSDRVPRWVQAARSVDTAGLPVAERP